VFNPINPLLHANVEYLRWIKLRLGWLLMTPDMHRVHHSPEARETNSNLGAAFSFWDRLFGTYVAPDPAREPPTACAASLPSRGKRSPARCSRRSARGR
jgi:sterol desaturase/sphingolipid hydroxylase (fatty acid hydroxylase superfamily)